MHLHMHLHFTHPLHGTTAICNSGPLAAFLKPRPYEKQKGSHCPYTNTSTVLNYPILQYKEEHIIQSNSRAELPVLVLHRSDGVII